MNMNSSYRCTARIQILHKHGHRTTRRRKLSTKTHRNISHSLRITIIVRRAHRSLQAPAKTNILGVRHALCIVQPAQLGRAACRGGIKKHTRQIIGVALARGTGALLAIFGTLVVGNIGVILVGMGHGRHGLAEIGVDPGELRSAAAFGRVVDCDVGGADATAVAGGAGVTAHDALLVCTVLWIFR